jgi:Ca2+-binding EF-hand superfamily protein
MTDEEAEQLLQSSAREIRAAFDLFDVDGDGTLVATELRDGLARLGQRVPLDEVLRLIASVDRDGDGRLDFDEFVALIEPRPADLDEEADLREAFAVLDLDRDGYVSTTELRAAVRRTLELPEAEVVELVATADGDGDGRISFAEFRELLRQAG